MEPVTAILLILLIKELKNETPQNVQQVEQTVIHQGCIPDSCQEPHGLTNERGHSPLMKNDLLPSDQHTPQGVR